MTEVVRLVPEPDDVPPRPDRVARATWERATREGLPPGPPYDAGERLQRLARDVEYLVDNARAHHRLAQLWHDRYLAYEDALLALVKAADRGGSLTAPLDDVRRLLPVSRYRAPRRRDT